jgi:hypothetical protein
MPRQLDLLFVRRDGERVWADDRRQPLQAALSELLRLYFRDVLDQERSATDGRREDPRQP